MGLSQGIVVVNEYTINNNGKGSRGSTPGNYIREYMSRDLATETLTPVKLASFDEYITRYMARESATETIDDRDDVKPKFRKLQGKGGVAFGYGKISLSDEELRFASNDIQKKFENGKTVMKTVLSFDEEYLRKTGIIPEDFVCTKDGDFRGNIDQMKLRLGIMHGLERLSRDYDDLQYIGVIQVDTQHVHCHLAMVDRGKGNITEDGTQRGKLSVSQKNAIRRGIDLYLDETKEIQHMSSNVSMDKRNTSMFIKRVSHKTMQQNGVSQFLLACLPEDKRLWRASSNSKAMEKANAVTRAYVRELFAQQGSGYSQVQKSIYEYAAARRNKEDLTGEEYRKIIKHGEKRVEDECINAVYGMLQNIEKRDKNTHTPMIDLMAMPCEDISKDADEFGEFTYKLRTYSTRLDYHKKSRDKAHNIVKSYDEAKEKGIVSEDAKPVYDFFKFEEEYNEMLLCKYQYFLHFIPPDSKYYAQFKELMDYKKRMEDVDGMLHDKTIRRMTEKNAEDYAERVYHQRGGRYMTFAPEVIETRLEHMQTALQRKDEDFAYNLATDGLAVDEKDGKPVFKRHYKYEFDDVKSLDIHHLGYDFPKNISISQNNINKFVEIAEKRVRLAQEARDYLVASGQRDELSSIDFKDIRLMKQVADKFDVKKELESKRPDENKVKPVRTTKLSSRYDIGIPIKQSLMEMRMEEEEENDLSRRHRFV